MFSSFMMNALSILFLLVLVFPQAIIYPPIDSIFQKLPAESDLHDIILASDNLGLIKLQQIIQSKSSQIPCEALLVYSNQIIGLMRSALQRKKMSRQQLQIIKVGIQQRKIFLSEQLEILGQERDGLMTHNFKKKIDEVSQELENAYSNFNQLSSKRQLYDAEIIGYNRNIEVLQQNVASLQLAILQEKLILNSYDTEISRLQAMLMQAKQKKNASISKIQEKQVEVTKDQDAINKNREQIEAIEVLLLSIDIQTDKLKTQYKSLEVIVERERSNFFKAQQRDIILVQKIEQIEEEIAELENRAINSTIQTLTFNIEVLESKIPKFIQQNARIYENCYGQDSIEILEIGNVTVYLIKGVRLPDILTQTYGKEAVNHLNLRKDLEFRVVDIFGPLWRSRYGNPFNYGYQQQLVNNLYTEGDFNCLSPSQVVFGVGTIKQIGGNVIQIIDDEGESVQLYLGSCSRIQSVSYIPEVGNKMLYTGIKVGDRQINVYSGTCL